MPDLKVVITGTSRGIGYHLAQRFLSEGYGVIGVSRSQAAIKHPEYQQVSADLRDIDQIRSLSAELSRQNICGLINNAGIHGPQVPVEDYPLENWQQVIAVDLTAVFVCAQAIVPHMKQAGYGRIVTIASQAGKEGLANTSAYNAAKAGVIGLMKGLSKELASFGITANCITPSLAETDLLKEMSDDHISGIRAKTLMGRLCTVSEVADMVTWVASPACGYSTGACFDVSGGRAQF